ncbi:16S rRNA (guanine(527)-N(7))-methyltransferase RsmG [Candidatus Lariskella endosymbiont of Hedychridium roseum]|uniref:16S rRNA (guanine(527)-N(7))-methyltransferase RsmG n=1 Tax=Candidatus Lariskella endosymbiont of Hedychridium roseum TaxID=3077949 RepID=UPI0030CC2025
MQESLNDYFGTRELELLQKYSELLLLWNKKINLVSRSVLTYEDLIPHILDSALLSRFIKNKHFSIADIGSGGGFPGMILAILGYNCILFEKNSKKTAFLLEVNGMIEINAQVVCGDVRDAKSSVFDVIVSRAFCDTVMLLDYTKHIAGQNTNYLLHKGKDWQKEVSSLMRDWHFDLENYNNIHKPNSSIISISNLQKNRHDAL